MKKVPVCPLCGSKNVTRMENFYRCADCKTDFGREALADNGLPMIDEVKGIRFRAGDIISGSIRLRFGQDVEGVCLYEVYDSSEGGLDKYAGMLSKEEWTAFKKSLFETVFVNDWDRVYLPVNDGQRILENNEWELAIGVNDREEYVYWGVDTYPVYWKQFKKLIQPFLDQVGK